MRRYGLFKKILAAVLAAAALLSLTGCGNLRRDMFLPREERGVESQTANSSFSSSVNMDEIDPGIDER